MRNFASQTSQQRIAEIVKICREPHSVVQIMSVTFMSHKCVQEYITHLKESGSLIVEKKIKNVSYYLSTGKYNPPEVEDHDHDMIIRKAAHIVPFRDPWLFSLFRVE